MSSAVLVALLAFTGGDDKEAEEALKKFDAAFKDPKIESRTAALLGLARTQHAKVRKRISDFLTFDQVDVQMAAVQALSEVEEARDDAGRLMAGAIDSTTRQPEVLIAVLDALGRLKYEPSLYRYHHFLNDKNANIVRAALRAIAGIGHHSSITPLISQLRDCERVLKEKPAAASASSDRNRPFQGDAVRKGPQAQVDPVVTRQDRAKMIQSSVLLALQAVSKETVPITAAQWSEWWEKNRSLYEKKK